MIGFIDMFLSAEMFSAVGQNYPSGVINKACTEELIKSGAKLLWKPFGGSRNPLRMIHWLEFKLSRFNIRDIIRFISKMPAI